MRRRRQLALVAPRESATLTEQLMATSCERQQILPD